MRGSSPAAIYSCSGFLSNLASAGLQGGRQQQDSIAVLAVSYRKAMRMASHFWQEKKGDRAQSSVAEMGKTDAEMTAAANTEASEGGLSTGTRCFPEIESANSSAAVEVDQMLMRFLVGRGGSIKEKLEKDYGVKLRIPSVSEAMRRSDVVINGTEAGIKEAQKEIKRILDDAVDNKLQYTHFISLPLAVDAELVQRVEEFQESVMASVASVPPRDESSSLDAGETQCREMDEGCGSAADEATTSNGSIRNSGIDRSIFVKPATFHLTVLMLKLWNEDRVHAARRVLHDCGELVHEALEGRPVVVSLKGVETMKGKPDKAHVLYARVEESKEKDRLLKACKILIDAYVECGLVMERDIGQSLKLHATLMNTTQRKVTADVRSRKRTPFDATEILKTYGAWTWGEHEIIDVHLSQRFVYDDNGYYHCVSEIPFF